MIDTGALVGELLWLVPALAAGGAVAGILAGLFGIGGGGVLVPVFYELYGIIGVDEAVRIHLCVGTSLAIIIPTAIRSYYGHRARGAVDMATVRLWTPWMLGGVAIGTLVAAYSPSTVMRAFYAVMTFLMGVRMAAGRDSWRIGDDMPALPLAAIYAVSIGIVCVLLGLGGGSYVTTVMLLYNRPIHQGVGTSSALGIVVSVPAAIGYVWAGWGIEGLPPGSIGYVNLLTVATVIPVSVLAAPIGVRLAHGLSRRQLERGFAMLLFAIAARFTWSLIS